MLHMSQIRTGIVYDKQLLKNQFLNMSTARANNRSTPQEVKKPGPYSRLLKTVDQVQSRF